MLTGKGRDMKYTDPSRAVDYSNNNDIQFKQAKDFIDAHGDLIKGPILDIGSGDGRVTVYISKKIGEPTMGIDISAERVKFANDRYGDDNLKFIVGNATCVEYHPELSSKTFKTIVSFNTLHHVPKSMQLSLFKQTKKLLTPDGIALLLIPGRSPALHDAINETASSIEWRGYFLDFDITKVRTYETPEYYKLVCAQAGFYESDVTEAKEAGGKEFDRNEMKEFLRGWLPHLAHLKIMDVNDSIQNKFLDDIVSLFFVKMKKSASESVSVRITQNKIIGYASEMSFFGRSKKSFQEANKTAVNDLINHQTTPCLLNPN